MQQWDYQFIIAEKYGKGVFGFLLPKEISWKVHYINGKQQTNWTDITLFNYLNKAGKEGWEVISMNPHTNIRTGALPIEHLYFVLKRPFESKGDKASSGTVSSDTNYSN